MCVCVASITESFQVIVKTDEDHFTTPDEASMEFGTVIADIAEELDNCASSKQNLENIKIVCCHLTNGYNIPLLSQEDKSRITKCQTIYGIFIVMQPHWNWYSHRLLLIIIKRVKSLKAKEMLKKFEEKINYAMKLKAINERLKANRLPVPQGYCKIKAIIDKDYSEITLGEYLEIETFVSGCLDLPQPSSEINESESIEIVWYISTATVDNLKSKALQYKETFLLKSFISLQVGDVVVFDTRQQSLSVSMYV